MNDRSGAVDDGSALEMVSCQQLVQVRTARASVEDRGVALSAADQCRSMIVHAEVKSPDGAAFPDIQRIHINNGRRRDSGNMTSSVPAGRGAFDRPLGPLDAADGEGGRIIAAEQIEVHSAGLLLDGDAASLDGSAVKRRQHPDSPGDGQIGVIRVGTAFRFSVRSFQAVPAGSSVAALRRPIALFPAASGVILYFSFFSKNLSSTRFRGLSSENRGSSLGPSFSRSHP